MKTPEAQRPRLMPEVRMLTTEERLLKLLQAAPEVVEAVDRLLVGRRERPEVHLNKEQLGEILGIRPRTVDLWMARGVISYLKVGTRVRFKWSVVERELDERWWVRRRAGADKAEGRRQKPDGSPAGLSRNSQAHRLADFAATTGFETAAACGGPDAASGHPLASDGRGELTTRETRNGGTETEAGR